MYFDQNITEVQLKWDIIAWCRTAGDKALPEPIVIQVYDAYICH